jgi:two-component system, LuxR family, sensor kinase FixL
VGVLIIQTLAIPLDVSEARLSSLLDTVADGIVVLDERARILIFNKACENLLGYKAAEMIGQNVKAIMPSHYAQGHDCFLSEYLRTGVRKIIGIGQEVQVQHRDGTLIPVGLSVGEAQTPDGRQFIGILHDRRPRLEVEGRLNQLREDLIRMARTSAMEELGAALAHELNQPLTALMLYLQAAVRANENAGSTSTLARPTLAILDKAVREAERAGSIVQRMRNLVQKREPLRRLVDLGPLVEDAIELTLLGAGHKARVVRKLPRGLPRAQVDPVQIQQVVVNLVRNALEAVKDRSEPELRVEARQEDETLRVIVEDNGPGIASDLLPNLFSVFSSSKRTGLGLGLAISRTIAQNHGGDLTVEPGTSGRGARFTLHLPLPESVQDG